MADTSFRASCKVFVQGNRADIRVPMREVTLADPNPPVKLYDTSGPYTDPDYQVDLKKGLPALRRNWTLSRGDAEELPESSSAYRRQRESDPQLTALRFTELRNPWRAKTGRCVTQMHYARQGDITPEMDSLPSVKALNPSSYATRWLPAERLFRPISTTRKRADDYWPLLAIPRSAGSVRRCYVT